MLLLFEPNLTKRLSGSSEDLNQTMQIWSHPVKSIAVPTTSRSLNAYLEWENEKENVAIKINYSFW